MILNDKELEKLEYLIGFVNTVAELVCDPEEMMDPNTEDSTVFNIGYWNDINGNLTLETIDGSDKVKDFKANLSDLITEIKNCSKVNFLDKWKELQEN